ncbi:HAD hydrolase-like protein [Gordonia sesuvii]|uniref:HAD hydrolase-like protein n=1 Tax=Gordonia sesuvii TaxID=3116777 RepID=UPI003D678C5D
MTDTPGTPEIAAHRADPADPSTVLLVDLDGTITDSFAGIANSFRYALSTVGAPDPSPDLVAGIAGPPMIDTLTGMGLDQATADAAMRAYRERYTDTGWLENAVYDGMADVLADLRSAGRTLAVATSKNEKTAVAILEHFGLAEHFAVIAGASDDGTRRAKSDVIAHALARLGVRADAGEHVTDGPVVMIGDRAHDVEGAALYGIPAVIVGWGYALDGEDGSAAWAVGSIADLREVLGV